MCPLYIFTDAHAHTLYIYMYKAISWKRRWLLITKDCASIVSVFRTHLFDEAINQTLEKHYLEKRRKKETLI